MSANDSGSPPSFSANPRGSGRTVHRLRRRVLSDQVHDIHIRAFVSLSGVTAEILFDGRGALTTRDVQASPRWSPPRGHRQLPRDRNVGVIHLIPTLRQLEATCPFADHSKTSRVIGMAPVEGVATTEQRIDAVLDAVVREYPHKLSQELNADSDVAPPRAINPSFFGSYDWHSAVHSHWTLLRSLGNGLTGAQTQRVVKVLDDHLNADRIVKETTFFASPGGRVSERPYGWAWLVALYAECDLNCGDRANLQRQDMATRWCQALDPLYVLLRGRLIDYFSGVLAYPIRTGLHANTAFALELLLQSARSMRDEELTAVITRYTNQWFLDDTNINWRAGPSGEDFLDPNLVEAALMADVLDQQRFAAWMKATSVDAGIFGWQPAEFLRNPSEPGAVHLEGLLMSRAWCLDAIANALGPDSRIGEAALLGRDAHLDKIARIDVTDGFARSHWLPTFLTYLNEQLEGRL
ncbi:DUF2891 family protein [Ferrimicrobium sp.]|uniref:DUF2891 family protein n=1 Tax=Ferrimicrobium sp. TaxID=2926050 RepID=UPI0026318979|nr:DUF2891 family protein [Ferrimicrobium sp.]